ncbi:MAG: DUF2207 domain-containing protein [Propionibacteriaceae bacterium]|nr:DUF2207 domain-containing protein [Propionibacteriaceae bacterium]
MGFWDCAPRPSRAAFVVGFVGAAVLGFGTAQPAVAETAAAQLAIEASLSTAGTLAVTAEFTFDGAAPDPFVQSFATTADLGGGQKIAYGFDTTAEATVDGQAVVGTVQAADGRAVVTIPTGGASSVAFSYTVSGVTRANADASVRFSWSVLQGLGFDVAEVTGKLDLPPGVMDYVCESGPAAALATCQAYAGGIHGNNAMTFSDGPRAAGDLVTVGAMFEAGAMPETATYVHAWSLGRAFTLGWDRIGLTVAVVAAGYLALFAVNRRLRRREGGLGTPVAELAPDEDGYTAFALLDRVRPGLVGTLIDRSVDPNDVLATLIDLAVRGHLRITELPRPSLYAVPDWIVTRRESDDPVEDYERRLLDAVAPPGVETRVSQITAAVSPAIGEVQDALYQRVVQAGWFSRRPGARSQAATVAWAGLGAAVLATAALIAWTTWAVVGAGLLAVALIGVIVCQDIPVLTSEGASVLTGLDEFAGQLHNAPTTLRPDIALAQGSAILPYAIVLGGWDRWLGALVAANAEEVADATELDWYHGPEGWELRDLPACLGAFITVVTGRLFGRS